MRVSRLVTGTDPLARSGRDPRLCPFSTSGGSVGFPGGAHARNVRPCEGEADAMRTGVRSTAGFCKTRRGSVAFLSAIVIGLALLPGSSLEAHPKRPSVSPDGVLAVKTSAYPKASYMPAQVLVQFRAGETREARSDALATVRPVRVKTLSGTQVVLVELQTGYGVPRAARVLGRQDSVAIAEPNFILRAFDVVPNDPLFTQQWGMNNTGQSHPVADPPPDFVSGAAGADANVASAWDLTQGSSDTVIAIIDSGVDLAHPDIAPSI